MPTGRAPEPTVLRLSIYLRCLRQVHAEGLDTISSAGIQERTGITAGQVRKDLSYFGEFGKPGLGYAVEPLLTRLSHIMQLDRPRKVVIVGAGNLGAALAGYQGLRSSIFSLVAAFDNNLSKIGRPLWDVEIKDVRELPRITQEQGVEIGIITTPAEAAQGVAELMAQGGIRSILNFSPTRIVSPQGTTIRNVDLMKELEVICFYLPKP
ncbi:MAG: redox-sensing transcriptional repressor Rex [Armatimonadetes bacterium]|nr:redox-sensing transcriptional repressor Rex [Armatimonadota bacterium]NIO75517.1 redox-sensing transcriptional repressor Rex [Armatimonadota bacterium]NIO95894.1 redox-sensing transcriptional repressor Rex [Armatimonadota bacterium]